MLPILNVAIVLGSTRPGRVGEGVAKWVREIAQTRNDAKFELVDIKDYDLPLLDEPLPPAMGQYSRPHTKKWSQKIASFDGYVFVTPEYNHGIPGALKNAIDFLFSEWNDKSAGFVSYGSASGVRAVEQLRLVMGEIKVADVRSQVALSLRTDFEDYEKFVPNSHHEKSLHTMLGEVIAWGTALRMTRMGAQEKVA